MALLGFFASWRTTLTGGLPAVIILLTQLLHLIDNDPKTVFSVATVVSALGLLGVSVTARDNRVTSKQAGAE